MERISRHYLLEPKGVDLDAVFEVNPQIELMIDEIWILGFLKELGNGL